MAYEHWYRLRVRAGFEAVVARKLREIDLEVLIPKHKAIESQESHRRGHSASYLYCLFTLEKQARVTSVPGVLDIVGAPDPIIFDGKLAALQTKTRFPRGTSLDRMNTGRTRKT